MLKFFLHNLLGLSTSIKLSSLLFDPGILVTSHTYFSKKTDTKNGKACTWEMMEKKRKPPGNKIQTKIQVTKVILKQSAYENTTGKNNRLTC